MCLSRLGISAASGEYVTVSADFNGKGESATSALVAPTFAGAAVDGFHFSNGVVTFHDGTTSTSLMMSNAGIFPPPVPVAPVYIQPNMAAGGIGNNNIITERPFRPPP